MYIIIHTHSRLHKHCDNTLGASAFTTELIEDLHKSENTSQRIRVFIANKSKWRHLLILCSCILRMEVYKYMCYVIRKWTPKSNTHQHLVKADITMRFKESAKRALNLMLFSYSLEQQNSIGNNPSYGLVTDCYFSNMVILCSLCDYFNCTQINWLW